MKILIAGPYRNCEYSLEEHLEGLENQYLNTNDMPSDDKIEYFFVTGNNSDSTEQILQNFLKDKKGEIEIEEESNDYQLHDWDTNRLKRMGELRNKCLQKGIEINANYVLMVDSDLILHPNTLKRLIDLSGNTHVTSTLTCATWDHLPPCFNYNMKLSYDGLTGVNVDMSMHKRLFRDSDTIEAAISYMNWVIPTRLIKKGIADFSSDNGEMEFKWFSKRLRDNNVKHLVDKMYLAVHKEASNWSLVYQE